MSVTVLGCDGSYAGPGGACSGYLVRAGATAVWIDCGPGTLANLQQHISLADLTAIVVSHVHPDHWVELPIAHNALKYYVGRTGVPVFGTEDVEQLLLSMRGPAGTAFEWLTITDGASFDVGPLVFTCSRTDHPVETLAFRVDDRENGRSLAYTSDTGPAWSLTALGAPVDLALIEATLAPDQPGGDVHLTGAQAGALARDAGARRLVITHLAPGSDPLQRAAEAADTYGGLVEVATVHERYDI